MLTTLELWCVMVQREVADRLFAAPSTKAYGAVSVLVQLAARRTGFHPSRVRCSGLLPTSTPLSSRSGGFRCRAASPTSVVSRREGSRHRRKTLANSLQLAGVATREDAVEALAELGLDPAVRAEALEPAVFVELARALG